MASLLASENQSTTNQILKDGEMVEDPWLFLSDNEPLPENDQPIVVSASRWLAELEACLAYAGKKGVTLVNTQDVSLLCESLMQLQLICVDFPKAVDGRAYSQARLLRDRYGYKNELRAIGDVRVDQLFLMVRCGINSYSLQPGEDVIQAARFLQPFSVTYQ